MNADDKYAIAARGLRKTYAAAGNAPRADDYVGLPLLTSGGVQLLVLEDVAAFAQEVLEEADS